MHSAAQNALLIMVHTKMIKKENKKTSKNQPQNFNNNSIISKSIIIFFAVITLFYESVLTLLGSFRRGILKKEILTKKNNLGFDLIIKRKK